MVDRDFEKFMGGPTESKADRLYVTINKDYVIGLNDKTYRLLGKPPAAYLYYSRARDTIMIEPVHSLRLPTAFPIKPRTKFGWRINASPFCTHFNIRLDSTQRFVTPEINSDGHLVLKLNETVTIRQLRRKKKVLI